MGEKNENYTLEILAWFDLSNPSFAREAEMSAQQRNLLAEFLEKKELTRDEFAEMIGVAPPTVGNYIRGERYPKVHTLREIVRATDGAVSPEDMMNIGHYCEVCLTPIQATHR